MLIPTFFLTNFKGYWIGKAGDRFLVLATVTPLLFFILNINIISQSVYLHNYYYYSQQQYIYHPMNLNSSQVFSQEPKSSNQQQQQINDYINKLQPIQNTVQQFQSLVTKWKQQSQQRAKKIKNWQEIVMAKEKDMKNYKKNSVCLVCFEGLTEKKNWCRVCGMECCEKCIGRFRVMPRDNNLQTTIQQKSIQQQNVAVPSCLKCDKLYIEALSELEFEKQLQLKIKVLSKIQHMDQKTQICEEVIVKPSSEKLIKKKSTFKVKKCLTQLALTATQISQMNQNVKLQTLQMKRKITWGENIKRRLTIQYNKIRKELHDSFSSSINNDPSQLGIAPPKAYESEATRSQAQLLNQSFVNSVIQDDTKMVIKGKCCTPCRIM